MLVLTNSSTLLHLPCSEVHRVVLQIADDDVWQRALPTVLSLQLSVVPGYTVKHHVVALGGCIM